MKLRAMITLSRIVNVIASRCAIVDARSMLYTRESRFTTRDVRVAFRVSCLFMTTRYHDAQHVYRVLIDRRHQRYLYRVSCSRRTLHNT